MTLPSLPAGAPHRDALDSVVGALADEHEVEAFAEHDRLVGARAVARADGEQPREIGGIPADGRLAAREIRLFHYLRLPQRHDERPFDAVLHPFGRDAPVYQGTYWAMRRVPGLIWVLDPVLHHFLLGDAMVRGSWSDYGRAVEASIGDERVADALVETVAAGWAGAAVFRRHDLATWLLSDRTGVLASSPPLAERLGRALGEEVGVVGLPWRSEPGDGGDVPSGGIGTLPDEPVLAFMTIPPVAQAPLLEAVDALLDGAPVAVRVCVAGPIYHGSLAAEARRRGVHERVEWILDPDWTRMAAVATDADMTVWLREDPTAGERHLLQRGLAAGKPTFVSRSALFSDLPEGAVAPLDPGYAWAAQLAATVNTLRDDPDLLEGLGAAARSTAAEMPGPRRSAARLGRALEAMPGPVEVRSIAASVREGLAAEMAAKTIPAGTSASARAEIAEVLRRLSARP